jgi:hypothetical protein
MAKAKTVFTVTFKLEGTSWIRKTMSEKKLRRFLKRWIPLRYSTYQLYIERHDRKVKANKTPWLP